MEVRGYQEKMQTLTRDSNCITNVWNNLTEGSGGGRAVVDLNNFGNEWHLQNRR